MNICVWYTYTHVHTFGGTCADRYVCMCVSVFEKAVTVRGGGGVSHMIVNWHQQYHGPTPRNHSG